MATKTNQKEQTTFEKLSAINVNSKVEKKNGLTYLSWAFAWSETKRVCPDATYQIVKDAEGNPYVYDESLGFMCETSVTIGGETLSMWLPVMDGKNQAMKKVPYSYSTRYGDKEVAAATSFDINKTLMRCLVKNLAMFGMGIYIYAGEDLPEVEVKVMPKAKPTPAKPTIIELKLNDDNWVKVMKYVAENKSLGLEKISEQLKRKYKITAPVKKEIGNVINAK